MGITYRIGRSVGKVDTSRSSGSLELTEQISKEMAILSIPKFKDTANFDPAKLQSQLSRVLEVEFGRAIAYATNSMMGQLSPGYSQEDKTFSVAPNDSKNANNRFIFNSKTDRAAFRNKQTGITRSSVTWQRLAGNTIRRKAEGANPGNARKFFLDTGGLRTFLKNNARSFARASGLVNVRVVDGEKVRLPRRNEVKVPITRLKITFLPKVYPNDLPGLASGDLMQTNPLMSFEKRLGITGLELDKLSGGARYKDKKQQVVHDRVNRPLLQPLFTYWTLFRFPARVVDVMTKASR